MEIIQEIGSYAGFAAVVGLAILSALYFSQARDVKRLREWAGRAPERAAELEEGGRMAVAAMPVAARPQPQARPAPAEGAAASKTAAPAKAAVAGAPAAAAAASAGAAPATASAGTATPDAPASAGDGAEEPDEATAGAGVGAATPAGAATNGSEADAAESAGDEAEADEAADEAASPAAATPAGASASAAGTADRPATAAGADTATRAAGDTGTGAKVLPARRPAPPVRPRPTIPPTRPPVRPGQTSVLGQAPGSRPPARRGGRTWPAPRYIALIVAGVVIFGLAGTVGILQLTKEDEQPSTPPPVTDLEDPTRTPDPPDDAPAIDPSTVKVAVLNATNTTGLAARIGSRLQSAGFQTGNLTNAAERARAESVVMYKDGKESEARAVARRLDIGSREPIDAASSALAGDASVVVILGADKAQQ